MEASLPEEEYHDIRHSRSLSKVATYHPAPSDKKRYAMHDDQKNLLVIKV